MRTRMEDNVEGELSKLPVGTFQGPKPTVSLPRPTHPPHYPPSWFSCGAEAVPGPEVPVKILQNNIANAATPDDAKVAREKLDELMKNRKFMEGVVHDIINVITKVGGLTSIIFT